MAYPCMKLGMNITALRPRFIRYLEPIADIFVRLSITPNQISVLALIAGIVCAYLFFRQQFVWGTLALILSAVFDLVDGSVARKTDSHSNFGAVFDWIVDKYVDGIVLLGIGLSGIPVVSQLYHGPAFRGFCSRCAGDHWITDEYVHKTCGICRNRLPG